MKDYIAKRAVEIANYIIENNATVRQTAKQFGISKSTLTENEKNLLHILTKLEEQEKDDLGKLSRELEHTLVGMNF